MFVGEIPELTAKSNGGEKSKDASASKPDEAKEEVGSTESQVKSVVGKHVTVDSDKGTEETESSEQESVFIQLWIGVRYDEPVGKNNGSILGKKFFDASKNCGGFVKPECVKVGVMSITLALFQVFAIYSNFRVYRTILKKTPLTVTKMTRKTRRT